MSAPRRRVRLCAVSVGLLVTLAMGAEQPSLLVRPVPERSADGRLAVWVYLVNEGNESVTARFPAQLTCRVQTGGGVAEASAELDPAAATGDVAIPQAGFRRARYWLSGAVAAGDVVVIGAGPVEPSRLAAGTAPAGAESGRLAGDAAAPVVTRREADLPRPDPARDLLLSRLSSYEPLYFVYGPDSPNIRYQISLRYPLVDEGWAWVERAPWLQGLNVAYTQTSLWDWAAPSSPFHDSSYKPELFLRLDDLGWKVPGTRQLDLQTGLLHESNGKGASDSRSLNIIYLKPVLTLGDPDGMHVLVTPRVWVYVADLSDNPDIDEYRGHADLTVTWVGPRRLELSAMVRAGDSFEHPAAQLDLSYPLRELIPAAARGIRLHAQFFSGCGESLLEYKSRRDMIRFGLSMIP